MSNDKNVEVRGNTIFANLWYPRDGEVKFVNVGLVDVRASDGIRICYDFERDGWSIQQPTVHSWDANDKVMDRGWREVAFAQSWQLDDSKTDGKK